MTPKIKDMATHSVPKEGEFQSGQVWFTRRGNVLTLGLTSRAMESLGDLDSIELPEEGSHFDAGDSLVVVDGNRGSIDLSAMSKGVVLEVNPVAQDLALVSEDPTEEGWLIKFQIDSLEELSDLE